MTLRIRFIDDSGASTIETAELYGVRLNDPVQANPGSVIAVDDGGAFRVSDDGAIHTTTEPGYFVNSSARLFLLTLRESARLLATTDTGRHHAEELRRWLNANDPRALDAERSWWAVIVEQIEDELL